MTTGRVALTDGPVAPALRRLAVPMGLGFIFMILVNLVDTFWVARLGTDALAAMTFTFPVVSVVLSIAIGLMVGASTAIARAIGQGDQADVRRLTTHALLLGVGVVVLISALGVALQRPLFAALGAEAKLIDLIEGYMTLWFAGAFFVVVPMMANGALRAAGDATTPMRMMMAAAITNAILDPAFIFGFGPIPALGLEGAAIATIISRVVGMIYAFAVLAGREKQIDFGWPTVAGLRDSWRRILSVGLPATVTNIFQPVATAALTAIVATHGTAAVAAYGVGARLEGLVLIAPLALGSALSPFIGQNWGAHLGDRVAEGVRVSLRFVIVWGLAIFAVLAIGAPWFAAAFTRDPDVAASLTIYLQVVPIGYAAGSTVGIASSAFNAVDRAIRSTVLSLLRALVVAIPVAWLGSQLFGLRGVFLGLVVAAVVAALLGLRWLRVLTEPDTHAAAEAPDPLPADADIANPAVRALVDLGRALPDVEVHRTRRTAIGFFVGQRELGHVHPDGHFDLALPVELGEALIEQGALTHHRNVEAGWFTHEVGDGAGAGRILRIAHALYAIRHRGADDAAAEADFEALSLSPRCRAGLIQAAERWGGRAHPA